MDPEFKLIDLKPQSALAIQEEVNNGEISKRMGEMFGELMVFFEKNGIPFAGPPFALYHSWDEKKTIMEIGFPISQSAKGEGRVKFIILPGGKAVTGFHIGPYEKLNLTYKKIQDWMRLNQLKPAGKMWEIYLTDPKAEPNPNKFVTQLFWPVEP